MPNTNSSKKRLRQNIKRRASNRSVRSNVRSQVRKVRQAVDAGDAEACESEFRLAVKKLDQAAAGGIIHRNAAARTKSRLSEAIKVAKSP